MDCPAATNASLVPYEEKDARCPFLLEAPTAFTLGAVAGYPIVVFPEFPELAKFTIPAFLAAVYAFVMAADAVP
jgi:hypothetical protein